MSSALNKRQQARNERALQDLIKSTTGNDRCADCGARNPGWASWSVSANLCDHIRSAACLIRGGINLRPAANIVP
ncbi:putative gtpase activating protein for arf [Diplodia seriata]|uniref:Protein gts1 n=2 Tax=Diplodia TaxID=66735 RepID=A0ABR3TG53_9PEZI|nr:putative gtpase activating protein for arf [Diplodia seriata]